MINNNLSASDFTNVLGLNFKVWRNRRKNLSAHKQQFSLPLLRALLFLLKFQMTHRKWNGWGTWPWNYKRILCICNGRATTPFASDALQSIAMWQFSSWGYPVSQLGRNVRGGNGRRVALVSYLCSFGLGFNVMKFINWMSISHWNLLAWISFLTNCKPLSSCWVEFV